MPSPIGLIGVRRGNAIPGGYSFWRGPARSVGS